MDVVDFGLAKKNFWKKRGTQLVHDIHEDPLAVASIGEVHLGAFKNGREFVIKFLKPDLKTKTSSELSLLHQLIPREHHQVLTDVIDSLSDSIKGELDLIREQHMLEKAEVYDTPRDGISSVKPIKALSSNSFFAMSKASGLPIYKVTTTRENVCSKLNLMSKLLKKWLDEALFGKGYFHGDLHGGNVIYDEQQDKLQLIDFGNAEILSKLDRSGIIKLIAGVGLKEETVLRRAFLDLGLSNQDVITIQPFVGEALANDSLTESEKINSIVKELKNRDLPLSHGFILFNRGRLLIEGQIAAIKKEMNSYFDGIVCTDSNQKPLGNIAKLYKKSFHDGIPRSLYLLGRDTFRIILKGYRGRT